MGRTRRTRAGSKALAVHRGTGIMPINGVSRLPWLGPQGSSPSLPSSVVGGGAGCGGKGGEHLGGPPGGHNTRVAI